MGNVTSAGEGWDAENDYIKADDVLRNPSFDIPEGLPEWDNNQDELRDDWQPANPTF